MKIAFLGAAREVTGSCFLLDTCGKKILVDCGMQQGSDEKNNQLLPFDAKSIDFVLLTHAHIDHSGRLPLLYKNGFKGKIYTTNATFELSQIMLKDSAHIQEMDAEFLNRKNKRAGKNLVEPIYSMDDAEGVLNYFVGINYNEIIELAEGIKVEFIDAGHLLGSASIKVFLEENGEKRKIIFSGDIGNLNQPIIKDYSKAYNADYVVMESTYGDKLHDKREDVVNKLANIIDKTLAKNGIVVIPSFAVGRTQELLYYIREIKARNLVKSLPDFKVVVDSPLAVEATTIYDNMHSYYDHDATKILENGQSPLVFSNLHLSVSTEESKALNNDEPKVIISTSGMCEAGRIRHHLKHNLWKENSTIVFVGYQAVGTLGRYLVEGEKEVKLFKETIIVKAKIETIQGMSAHADRNMLFDWIKNIKNVKKIFLVHGEENAQASFKNYYNENFDTKIDVPNYLETIDLITGKQLEPFDAIAIPNRKKLNLFNSVLGEAKKLVEVVESNKGISNRNLREVSKIINEAINKILY